MNPTDLLSLTDWNSDDSQMPCYAGPSDGWAVVQMFRAMKARRSLALAFSPEPVIIDGIPY